MRGLNSCAGAAVSKVETVAEYLARGGVIKKVQAGGGETVSYANRTLKNTKKEEWNKLKAWRVKQIEGAGNEIL